VIQLDNTTKGNTAMTPQEEALNNQICVLPVITDLQAKDEEIIKDLEGLQKGQKNIEMRLDKGAERMDGIEGELKDLKSELRDGLKNVISEVRDQKLSELKNELKDRKTSDSSLKNDIIKIAIVTIIGAIGYLFIKAYG
jgi:predicted nuclease with TOPRIM domain